MSNLYRNSAVVFFLLISARAFAFLRNIVLVNRIGTGIETDAFYAATNIIEFFILFSGLNAMKSVATSTFTEEIKLKKNYSQYFSSLNTIILIYGLLVSLPALITPGFFADIFTPGFSAKGKHFVTSYISALSFMICFKGVSLIFGNLFGVKNNFFLQNIFLVFVNAAVFFVVLFSPPCNLIIKVCVSLVITYGISLIIQMLLLTEKNCRFISVPFSVIKRYGKKFIRLGFPLLFVTMAFSVAGIVDKAIASFFGKGVITHISLAHMVCFLPITVILVPLSNVFFPHFSSLYHKGDNEQLKIDYNRGQLIVINLFIPITVFIMFFSRETVFAFFYRKNFIMEDVAGVSMFMFVYSFALLFNSLYYLISFLFQSTQKNHIVGRIGLAGYLVNIFSSILLSMLLGPVGIPLGSAFSFLVFFILGNFSAAKHFNLFLYKETLFSALFCLTISLLSAVLIKYLSGMVILSSLSRNINHVLKFISISFSFALLYFLFLYPVNGKKILRILKEWK